MEPGELVLGASSAADNDFSCNPGAGLPSLDQTNAVCAVEIQGPGALENRLKFDAAAEDTLQERINGLGGDRDGVATGQMRTEHAEHPAADVDQRAT